MVTLFPPFLPAFEAIAFQFRAAEANNFGPEMQGFGGTLNLDFPFFNQQFW